MLLFLAWLWLTITNHAYDKLIVCRIVLRHSFHTSCQTLQYIFILTQTFNSCVSVILIYDHSLCSISKSLWNASLITGTVTNKLFLHRLCALPPHQGPQVQRVRMHKKVAYAPFHVNDQMYEERNERGNVRCLPPTSGQLHEWI